MEDKLEFSSNQNSFIYRGRVYRFKEQVYLTECRLGPTCQCCVAKNNNTLCQLIGINCSPGGRLDFKNGYYILLTNKK